MGTVTRRREDGLRGRRVLLAVLQLDDRVREGGPEAAGRPRHPLPLDAQRRGESRARRPAEGHRAEPDHRQQVHRHGEPAQDHRRSTDGRRWPISSPRPRRRSSRSACSPAITTTQAEWSLVEGQRPIDILAAGTPKTSRCSSMSAACVAAGADPVAFIKANPGRITSLHCKDWAPGHRPRRRASACSSARASRRGRRSSRPPSRSAACEYYLLEQEGSRFSEFETAERCIATYKQMRG